LLNRQRWRMPPSCQAHTSVHRISGIRTAVASHAAPTPRAPPCQPRVTSAIRGAEQRACSSHSHQHQGTSAIRATLPATTSLSRHLPPRVTLATRSAGALVGVASTPRRHQPPVMSGTRAQPAAPPCKLEPQEGTTRPGIDAGGDSTASRVHDGAPASRPGRCQSPMRVAHGAFDRLGLHAPAHVLYPDCARSEPSPGVSAASRPRGMTTTIAPSRDVARGSLAADWK